MGIAPLIGQAVVENNQQELFHAYAIRRLRVIQRNLRDASNPFEVTDENFRQHYR